MTQIKDIARMWPFKRVICVTTYLLQQNEMSSRYKITIFFLVHMHILLIKYLIDDRVIMNKVKKAEKMG